MEHRGHRRLVDDVRARRVRVQQLVRHGREHRDARRARGRRPRVGDADLARAPPGRGSPAGGRGLLGRPRRRVHGADRALQPRARLPISRGGVAAHPTSCARAGVRRRARRGRRRPGLRRDPRARRRRGRAHPRARAADRAGAQGQDRHRRRDRPGLRAPRGRARRAAGAAARRRARRKAARQGDRRDRHLPRRAVRRADQARAARDGPGAQGPAPLGGRPARATLPVRPGRDPLRGARPRRAHHRRRQRDREVPLRLRRWPCIVRRPGLRLLGLRELCVGGGGPARRADHLGPAGALGPARAGPLGHDLRQRRPRVHVRGGPALRHEAGARARRARAGRPRRARWRASLSATRPGSDRLPGMDPDALAARSVLGFAETLARLGRTGVGGATEVREPGAIGARVPWGGRQPLGRRGRRARRRRRAGAVRRAAPLPLAGRRRARRLDPRCPTRRCRAWRWCSTTRRAPHRRGAAPLAGGRRGPQLRGLRPGPNGSRRCLGALAGGRRRGPPRHCASTASGRVSR